MKATVGRSLNLGAFVLAAADSGKPRRFQIEAYDGGPLPVEGFDHPVIVDLSSLTYPDSIPILIDHTASVEATLGSTDQIKNDGQQLTMSGTVTATSATALQVVEQHDKGQRWQASIGVRVGDLQEVKAGAIVVVNKQQFRGPVMVARNSQMYETSVLPAGADWTTQVNLAAQAATQLKGIAIMGTLEDWLVELGIDAATVSPENMAALQLAFDQIAAPEPEAVPEVPASVPAPPVAPLPVVTAGAETVDAEKEIADVKARIRKEISAVHKLNAEIEVIAAGYPLIIAAAIEKGWSKEKVELEVLKVVNAKTRPTSFTGAQNSPDDAMKVVEAAICGHRGLTNNGRDAKKSVELDDQYEDKILQAAHSKYRNGIGLQQVLLIAASQAGMPLSAGQKITTNNLREVMSYAFPQQVEAAFSSLSVPGILGNVANKEILQGYMEEDAVWREVGSIKSVSDFKTVTSYRMLDDMGYEELGPGGTIKHGSLDEESYTRQASTYAKMSSITRTDIINDDLSAFDDLRARVGRGGAIKLNSLFWTTWLSNAATIWTAARTNYISGSTTNLGTDGVGLGLGQKAFRSRTSPAADGAKRLNGAAKMLLVPPELEVVADQLHTARNAGQVSIGDTNTFTGKYQPIVANQLSDTSFTGNSTTAWWLLGDKGMGSAVCVSFLNGQETPTVESADADFNTLGIQFRGYHDFGCDAADYLNSIHSKGAA